MVITDFRLYPSTAAGAAAASRCRTLPAGENGIVSVTIPLDRVDGKSLERVMQRFLHYESDTFMVFHQITFSWFVQNQIKGHAPSARTSAYPEVGLVGVHGLQTLFDVVDGFHRNIHQFHIKFPPLFMLVFSFYRGILLVYPLGVS